MTWHFSYCPSASARWLGPGKMTFLEVVSMVVTWSIVLFWPNVGRGKYCQFRLKCTLQWHKLLSSQPAGRAFKVKFSPLRCVFVYAAISQMLLLLQIQKQIFHTVISQAQIQIHKNEEKRVFKYKYKYVFFDPMCTVLYLGNCIAG